MSFILANPKGGRARGQEYPSRALAIVAAASTSIVIRSALASKGYTPAVHRQFWLLLHELCGYRGGDVDLSEMVRSALTEVDQWDDPTFRLARAALHHDFPAQHDHVFANLEAASGPACLVGVATFLDRLDELESSKERKSTRKADEAALAKLAERGITPEERARMRGLVNIAQSALDDPEGAQRPPSPEAATRLRAMVDEWTEVARVVLKRRSDLIQIGVAKRKKPGSKSASKKKAEVVVVQHAQAASALLPALPPHVPAPVADPATPVAEPAPQPA